MRILVTGGAGYIGSHTALRLLEAGHDVTVVDNLANSSRRALERVQELTGRAVPLHAVDLLDEDALDRAVADSAPEAVVHFAALKAVGESVAEPLRYYRNNVSGSLALLQCLQRHGCRRVVFSSSATVYGDPDRVPVDEDAPLRPTNPYGWTKLVVEQALRDLAASDPSWSVALLRYFNPVGAHPSGRIGEDPRGTPNNLLPFVAQVAVGRRERLVVHGDDYPTPDGTGVRDYIHVLDLADGHLAALERLADRTGCHTWNLGTGRGHSVLEVVHAFERASGRQVPYEVRGRRAGDAAVSFADPRRAARDLGWRARRDLDAMCADAWRWQEQNPRGYEQD
ncbi:UDP-glucose 4-epimerase GalE [Thalassiella azotivora]